VVGGGAVAERKVHGLLLAGARITVISPEVTAGLAELLASGRLTLRRRVFRQGDLAGSFLVIAATDDDEVQRLVCLEAEKGNILLNVADVPERCNFILPAVVRRGALSVAVSTGGKSPALAKKMRQTLEKTMGPEYETVVNLLGALRPVVLRTGHSSRDNRELFYRLAHEDLAVWIRERQWDRLEKHLGTVLGDKAEIGWQDILAGFREEQNDASRIMEP
jgi:precorrin-2 dehydrogenase/sirohydrochlorin ferrochelatase